MILPNKTLANKLEVHQKKVLKQNLSLPTSTSDAAVYVISGFYHGKHKLIKRESPRRFICRQKDPMEIFKLIQRNKYLN